jgi:hypothetical protein
VEKCNAILDIGWGTLNCELEHNHDGPHRTMSPINHCESFMWYKKYEKWVYTVGSTCQYCGKESKSSGYIKVFESDNYPLTIEESVNVITK